MNTEPSKLFIQQLVAKAETACTCAKPMQDAMVNTAMEILGVTTEIYRRFLARNLEGFDICGQKLAMSLDCRPNPQEGLPKLKPHVESLAFSGIQILRISRDTTGNQFNLYTMAPELLKQWLSVMVSMMPREAKSAATQQLGITASGFSKFMASDKRQFDAKTVKCMVWMERPKAHRLPIGKCPLLREHNFNGLVVEGRQGLRGEEFPLWRAA